MLFKEVANRVATGLRRFVCGLNWCSVEADLPEGRVNNFDIYQGWNVMVERLQPKYSIKNPFF